ncbi:alpha carbonic anhydrase [Microdochium trichocladiopsis]|uniref:carbonic anhydrase n=1 Tax=Microdochium trichocladiopsis TaxID=1682393 RepID=A0A9P8YG27_9PEZI|nr:alpha carbonic anhydrase [Microdochium trichocladiopsis]KAH7037283.1 alpha carbonic anhydrase [Microdochium trichocladiopsis]
MISQLLLAAAAITPAMAFCGGHTHLDRRAEGEVPINTFGYTGAIGPLFWNTLAAENTACNTGTTQSPIDMVAGVFNMVHGADISLEVPDVPAGAVFENLGTTVEVVMEGVGGKLTLPSGTELELKQFHFHHPSEHIDNGVSMPMEMHMVFQTTEAIPQTAVIGVYVDVDSGAAAAPIASIPSSNVTQTLMKPVVVTSRFGRRQNGKRAPSSVLETVFASVGAIATPGTKTTTGPLVMSEIVNAVLAGGFQSYAGSLTTPPCSEQVTWLVSTQKLTISAATFINARNILGFNSRFPQNAPGQPNVLAQIKL